MKITHGYIKSFFVAGAVSLHFVATKFSSCQTTTCPSLSNFVISGNCVDRICICTRLVIPLSISRLVAPLMRPLEAALEMWEHERNYANSSRTKQSWEECSLQCDLVLHDDLGRRTEGGQGFISWCWTVADDNIALRVSSWIGLAVVQPRR